MGSHEAAPPNEVLSGKSPIKCDHCGGDLSDLDVTGLVQPRCPRCGNPIWANIKLLAFRSHVHCPCCGYDLHAVPSPKCPECGTPRPWRVRDTGSDVAGLGTVLLALVIMGAICLAVCMFVGRSYRLLTIVCACGATALVSLVSALILYLRNRSHRADE